MAESLSITERLRAPRGRVSLAECDPNATPGLEGDKPETEAALLELPPAREIERRYDAINAFEARLAATGTAVIKCMLHISAEEQKARLRARLDDPTKHWKFNPGDVDERALWPKYQAAYELALERCNTDTAPWLTVPSDRKWYKNWAIASVLREALEKLNLDWPKAGFDVDEQKRRLAAT